jgi:hypothetical protein
VDHWPRCPEKNEKIVQGFIHKPQVNLGRRRSRRQDNIKIDLKRIRCEGMHWIFSWLMIWYTTSRKVAGSNTDEVIGYFNSSNPSSRTMAMGSTEPLTEMSIRNLPGVKGRSARKADNLTAICEPTVWKMWEPRRLKTIWAFTACYR